MILPLTIYANPVLRQKGTQIKKFDGELTQAVNDMLETMRHNRGLGLAAQQVGRPLQLAVIDISGIEDRPSSMTVGNVAVDPTAYMPLILTNPKVEGTKTKDAGIEGCLSFPGLRFEVSRSRRVKVTTYGLDGKPFTFEAGGLLGIAIQHEYDHLQGKLYIDYLTVEERREMKEKLAAIERGEIIKDNEEE